SERSMGDCVLGHSAISLLAELLESTLDQTRMLWSTGPAATELERVTLDWVRQLLGLPEQMFGMFHTNSRVDLALVAAIESLPEFGISDNGLTGMSPFRCYASA